MRTYTGGGGVNEKRTGAYKGAGGGGGVRNWQFYCVRTLWMPPYTSAFLLQLTFAANLELFYSGFKDELYLNFLGALLMILRYVTLWNDTVFSRIKTAASLFIFQKAGLLFNIFSLKIRLSPTVFFVIFSL